MENELPKKKENSIITYILAVIVFLLALVFIFPAQSSQLLNALFTIFRDLTSLGQIIIVVILIVLVVYVLRRSGKI